MARRPPRPAPPIPRRRTWIVVAALGLFVGLLLLWQIGTSLTGKRIAVESGQQSEKQLLATARRQMTAKRWSDARATAETLLQSEPKNSAALLIAAEASTRLEQFSAALELYGRVLPADPEPYLLATRSAAEIHRVYGSVDAAVDHYRTVLQRAPDDLQTLTRLATLLMLTGRPATARPFLLRLVELGGASPQHLQWLADPERPAEAAGYLERTLEYDPGQVFPQLGLANVQRTRGGASAARIALVALRQRSPQQVEIEATYARCLLDEGKLPELAAWWSELSDGVRGAGDVWYFAGALCESRQQPREACRCYLECLERLPDHREAAYRAGQLLVAAGERERGGRLLRRSEELAEIARLAGALEPAAPQAEMCQSLSTRLEDLDRNWEALAWADLAARAGANADWLQSAARRLSQKVQQTAASKREALPDLAAFKRSFPLPTQLTPVESPAVPGVAAAQFSFVDEAAAVGIDFTYFEDPDPATEGRRMREFTGGGVAVLDYDQDGWPDLYFTQGAELKHGDKPHPFHLDQLYRNIGGERFSNVTEASAVRDESFSGGVSAGDFNNDGFPDLYVANLGRNRLFENRGDGTFREVSSAALPDSNQWTTSCAIADLNLDGIPDLFDVNYLEGENLHEQICQTPAGPRVCNPTAFPAARDRICLGNGDGTFRDVSADAGLELPDGKGLGLLIGDLSGSSPVDVFVANDTTANYLLVPEQRGPRLRYRETAVTAGVAFSHEGRGQACMGIAAADFDGNGRLDLFVTNYFNEPNALYLTQSAGQFEDLCQGAGLRQPSLPMLGFGTQALDVDLDGQPDLVVANGDLDDFSHEARAFRMRPQLFHNRGQARFDEWLSAPEGDYFAATSVHRGRGLALIDWNRDGRQDFVVSHLDERASLVTNRTESAGTSVSLRLIGTVSSRDAIGARVTVTSKTDPHFSRTHWLTGGDGYQTSNERSLHVGTGTATGPFTASIAWPSGRMSTVGGLVRGSERRVAEVTSEH